MLPASLARTRGNHRRRNAPTPRERGRLAGGNLPLRKRFALSPECQRGPAPRHWPAVGDFRRRAARTIGAISIPKAKLVQMTHSALKSYLAPLLPPDAMWHY